jgi:hypothetical protein
MYHRVRYTSKQIDGWRPWKAAMAKCSVAMLLDDAVQAVLVSLRPRPEEAPEAIWLPWRAWRGHGANFRAKSFGQR